MFTSFDTFFNNYRIKNNTAPNETVLNSGLLRLKREIRELKSLIDLITGTEIETYNPEKPYELDEYVKYRGYCYKSLIDVNISNNPENSQFWKKFDLPSLKELQLKDSFHYLHFKAEKGQTQIELPVTDPVGTPCVFVEGILADRSEYYIEGSFINFYKPLTGTETVSVLYTMAFESGYVLPSTEITADQDQYIFKTDFDTYYASVFKNGLLLSPSEYEIQKNQISLEVPCNNGDKVKIVAGTLAGVQDVVSDSKLKRVLEDYYRKSEVYSKEETDSELDLLEQQIYTDSNIVKSSEIFTKSELRSFLNDKVSKDEFNSELTLKANKATSISGYNIRDAYTKSEIDEFLDKKISDSELTGSEITQRLNKLYGDETPISVSKISGKSINDLVQQNTQATFNKQVLIGGSDKQNITLRAGLSDEFPELLVKRRENSYNEEKSQIINGISSKDKFITIQGDFKGIFEVQIQKAGIVNPDNYNWTVQVIPGTIPVKSKFDFVPRGSGFGLTQKAFYENRQVDASHFYGFVSENVLKCYAFAEIGTDPVDLREWPAHYVLTGIHKSLSTNIYLNQGEQNDYIKFAHESQGDFEKNVEKIGELEEIKQGSPNDKNALELLSSELDENSSDIKYKSEKPGFFTPEMVAEKYVLSETDEVQVTVMKGLPNSDVKIVTTGDIKIVNEGSLPVSSKSFKLDNNGELFFKISSSKPFTKPGTVSLVSTLNESCQIDVSISKA